MSTDIVCHSNEHASSNVIIFLQTKSRHSVTGLLSSDNPEVHAKVKVSPGGIKFYRHHPIYSPIHPIQRKPRGEVLGFSKSSQRNFRETLMRLNLLPFFGEGKDANSNNGFFITLDWPVGSEWTAETLYTDLERIYKKLNSDYGNRFLGAVWKKELKENGTPHVHIIALFNEHLLVPEMQVWAKDLWAEIVGVREKYGVDVRPLYGNPSQLVNYLLKPYIAGRGAYSIGRVWGKWNSRTLPFVEPEILGLSREDYPVFLERLRSTPQAKYCKMIRSFTPEWHGGRVLGNGDELKELLSGLPSEELQDIWS